MVILLTVIAVLASAAVVYYVYEASRLGRIAEELEGENADLRGRISNLVAEVRRLRETSGASTESQKQSADDELMPIRRTSRAGATKGRSGRSTGSPDLVALVSSDGAEKARIADALTANGYRTADSSLADAPRYAHEISTAAVVFDLRHPMVATGIKAIIDAFSSDPLAKEVPLFALVATNLERERLIDEGVFTAVFLAPTDTALLISNLGAALIRRRTRAQRAEAARSLSSMLSR